MDIDEVIYGVNTVVIPPQKNRIIYQGTDILGAVWNKIECCDRTIEERRCTLTSWTTFLDLVTQCIIAGVKRFMSPYPTSRISQLSSRRVPVGCMVATNIIPNKILLPGTLEALNKIETNEVQSLSIEERRRKLFKG